GSVGGCVTRGKRGGRGRATARRELWRSITTPPSAPSAVWQSTATTGCSLAATMAATRPLVLQSFVTSCQRITVNPFAWLKDVLSRIAVHPITRLTELLPPSWAASAQP